jgi:D-cysteine desulfhydrase
VSIGGSPLFGIGTPLGVVGFINAICELKKQIERGILPEPDYIFVAAGSIGTSAGLTVGCQLLGLNTKVLAVSVTRESVINPKALIKTGNKAIKYLRNRDHSFKNIKITEDHFEIIKGYLGSGYGKITKKSQDAVDLIYELEGKSKNFKLDTTYTGKTAAAMLDFLRKEENKTKTVLFWNTYNSNNLDKYLKETDFAYQKLPKKFHKFYSRKSFQCWQITECPEDIKNKCAAFLNHEYRFWKVSECQLEESKKEKAVMRLKEVIQLEDM